MPVYDANNSDAPLWQLLVSIHNKLESLVFDAVGNDPAMSMASTSVVIRKLGSGSDSTSDTLPGIVISMPQQNTTPWEAGTNVEVESRYPVLIQIIMPDLQDKISGVRTMLKWQNMICRRLSAPNLELVDVNSEGVGFEISQATAVFNLDRKVYNLHNHYQCGVILDCTVRETWTTE